MIRKCNTSTQKTPYTPMQMIQTSEFIDNEQDYLLSNHTDKLAEDEIGLNIIKIRQCKRNTEQFMKEIADKLEQEGGKVAFLSDLYTKQREKSKLFKQKFHHSLIELRKKEEQCESLERRNNILQEKYNFIKVNGDQQINRLMLQQQAYKQKIHLLQSQLEELQSIKQNTNLSLSQTVARIERYEIQSEKQPNQSTFI